MLVVFAAGNDASTTSADGLQDWYPGAYTPTIAVAAVDNDHVAADFTNWGSWIDISAPGVDIMSTYLTENGGYGLMSGTSMAW